MIMKDTEEKKIACCICKKLIPKAAALHAEGEQYVLHFCDIECLDFWKDHKHRDAEKP
jgi:hypothetical protein